MKIQDIIDKLDEFDAICPVCKSGIKQFIQSSLTSLLDSIEKELPKELPFSSKANAIDRAFEQANIEGKNSYRQEVINIINSHK